MPTPLTDELLEDISNNVFDDEVIDLSSNHIDNMRAIQLAKALMKNEHIKIVYLSDNVIKDEGIKALASVRHLKELGLSDNKFGLPGLKALAESHLEVLHISNNKVGEGISYFCNHPYLVELHARECEITGADIALLAKGKSKLEILSLGHNRIDDYGAKALARIETLKRVNLTYNEIEDKSIFNNCKIKDLYLRNNPCDLDYELVFENKESSKSVLETKKIEHSKDALTASSVDSGQVTNGLAALSLLKKSSGMNKEQTQEDKSVDVKRNSEGKRSS